MRTLQRTEVGGTEERGAKTGGGRKASEVGSKEHHYSDMTFRERLTEVTWEDSVGFWKRGAPGTRV